MSKPHIKRIRLYPSGFLWICNINGCCWLNSGHGKTPMESFSDWVKENSKDIRSEKIKNDCTFERVDTRAK